MAKKKQDENIVYKNVAQDDIYKEFADALSTRTIRDIISPFVDPDNELMVKMTEDTVIVNATQIPKHHLLSLMEAMEGGPYLLVVMVGHPDGFDDSKPTAEDEL